MRGCANKCLVAPLSARNLSDIPSIKNLCMEQRKRGRKAQTSIFIWVREFKEVNHSCRKSLFRMQESGENVFTSVLSSGSLKFLGDRKSQKSAGIALIQNWPVTRFSHSSSHADSSMQKSWVNIKFSTIHYVYFGFGSFLFWVFTKQCLPHCWVFHNALHKLLSVMSD